MGLKNFFASAGLSALLSISTVYSLQPPRSEDVVYVGSSELQEIPLEYTDEYLPYQRTLQSLSSAQNESRFTFNEIADLYEAHVPLPYIRSFYECEDDRIDVFSAQDIHTFYSGLAAHTVSATHAYAFKDALQSSRVTKRDALSIAKYDFAGFDPQDFSYHDTSKPNAFLFFPQDSDDGVFWNYWALLRYRKLAPTYDLFIRFGEEDDDYFSAREDYRQLYGTNPTLTWIMGHGNASSIRLGDEDGWQDPDLFRVFVGDYLASFVYTSDSTLWDRRAPFLETLQRSQQLDLSDRDRFAQDMSHDSFGNTYFLFSCKTCEGGIPDGQNFGSMLGDLAEHGQRIIGSSVNLSGGDIRIKSVLPFDADIKQSSGTFTETNFDFFGSKSFH